jgi:hypothetical protein
MAPSQSITIDVSKDLDSASDLQKLISSDTNVLFQLGSVFAKFLGQPISSAVGTSYPTLKLTDTLPTWKAGPVTFSLSPSASCKVTIAKQGEPLTVALNLDDPSKTTDVQLTADGSRTYINIDLDFEVSGSAAGSGTAYGFTISGKASGSAVTTLSFCQPVPSDTETADALKLAFSNLVFPTSPDCAVRMVPGSSCRFNFDGTLNWELDVSYSLAPYKLSAPSAALVQQSLKTAWTNLTLPTATVDVGPSASVKYAHTDQFGLVVTKKDDNSAFLYLVRSSSDEFDENAGVTVGVTTTSLSATLDSTQLQQAVQNATGSSALAATVANTASQQIDNFVTAETAKINKWISDANGNIGLSVALSQKNSRLGLFNYQVDVGNAGVATQSWGNLLTRNVVSAMKIPGFTLEAGSGVTDQLQRSSTFQFQFFNLYKYSTVHNFFDTCTTELAADGTLRISDDTGLEVDVTSNKAFDKLRVHFSAIATEDTQGNVKNAQIDLNIEISEQGDTAGAAILARLLGSVSPSLQSAISDMIVYAHTNPGTLSLIAVLKSSAYGRLLYSPYQGNKPPADQTNDSSNWNAIHAQAVGLLGYAFVTPWTYELWGQYNGCCNAGDPAARPDRKHVGSWGSPQNLPDGFWRGCNPDQAGYFLRASAEGMNMFEDLAALAAVVPTISAPDDLATVEERLVSIVKGSLNIDYSKPIMAAVMAQAAAGAQLSVNTVQATDSSSFTTKLLIS